MAWETVPLIKLERAAARLRDYSERMTAVVQVAKQGKLSEVVLHWRQFEQAVQRVMNGVTTAEMHVPDQIDCLATGDMPMWHRATIRSAANKARELAKKKREQMEAEGLVKKPAKNAKRKG